MARILIIDSDPQTSTWLSGALREHGFEAETMSDVAASQERLAGGDIDLVIAELSPTEEDTRSFVAKLRGGHAGTRVILSSAFGTVEDAVEAMRSGASDYLSKPFSWEQVQIAVERCFERVKLESENKALKAALDDRLRSSNLVANNEKMQAIFKTVNAVAPTRTTVLLTGESGTGKTLLARAIHSASERRDEAFIEVNCGALPESLLESELFGHTKGAFTGAVRDREGKFAAADKGTIFLDEIGTSSPSFQVKLLRVLQDRVISRLGDSKNIEIDVRVILATNINLQKAVEEGGFREDLFYRINVVPLEMPPLRDRTGDIGLLAEHFLRRFCEETGKRIEGFSQSAMHALRACPWPGNVRQLENVVERAVVLCEGNVIGSEDLPSDLRGPLPHEMSPESLVNTESHLLPLKRALEAPEKLLIERALQHHGGNRQATASTLGINRSTLFNKMRKFNLL
ncbi:MAG: sigma-54-dependent transcriptional regulator [Planctomycetota bacterium]|jgi:DNA-binding NtrC family response regulator